MKPSKLFGFAMALAGSALLFGPAAEAQEGPPRPKFKKPVRIVAEGTKVGHGRYYPSPVMHDVDGDKLPDLVVGDLMGRVTWAKCLSMKPVPKFAKEQPLLKADGKPLKFSNW